MNYKNYGDDNSDNSLETEFAEKAKPLDKPLPYQTLDELQELGTLDENVDYIVNVWHGLQARLPEEDKSNLVNEIADRFIDKIFRNQPPNQDKSVDINQIATEFVDKFGFLGIKGGSIIASGAALAAKDEIREIIKKIPKLPKYKIQIVKELLEDERIGESIQKVIVSAKERELKIDSIDENIIVDLLEGMGRENSTLQEIYQNLFLVAITGGKVETKDINNVNLLESNDVLILETMFEEGYNSCRGEFIEHRARINRDALEISIDGLIAQGIVESTTLEEAVYSIEIALSGITRDKGVAEYTRPGDPILDLEYIQKSFQNALKRIVEAQTIDKYDSIKFTTRGWEFMRKCKGIITKSVETKQNP
jgi:hypothetical protein